MEIALDQEPLPVQKILLPKLEPRLTPTPLSHSILWPCKREQIPNNINQVSWLRPRENEILTAGRYTYIGDSRFASINDNGSHDWILEIKDVGLNDSTSYECQVSTDPKMSVIINLQVKGKWIAVDWKLDSLDKPVR